MKGKIRILLIEDSPDDAALVSRELKREGYEVEHERVETAADLIDALKRGPWDVVVSDHSMPEFNSTAALEIIRGDGLDTPFIIVSGSIGEDVAVAAMKAGASDYVLKGNLSRLVPAIEREIRDAENRRVHRETEADRQRLREQLLQAQKMESIGRLAGGVAHDFNNLLTTIIGYSQICLRRMSEDDPMRQNIEEIKHSGQRAAALTSQLLAFSRKQVLSLRPVDLNSNIVAIEKMLVRLLGEDVVIKLDPDPTLPLVMADAAQIDQVLMNLAVNARDAMPRGGQLAIATRNVVVDDPLLPEHFGAPVGRFALLAIADDGCGMDEQTKSKIFEPFFTTKDLGKGTGLGLSTVFGIVSQLGGAILVDSAPGEGTTFRIYLPIAEDEVEEQNARIVHARKLRGTETVLIVEDEENVRKLARDLLEMNGYKVLCAGGGEAALKLGEEYDEPIHVLLADVVMPHMSGREVAERFGKIRPGIRVLFMSGYTDDAVLQHGVLENAVAFIQKPFEPDELVAKIRELIDKEPRPSMDRDNDSVIDPSARDATGNK